MSRGHKIVANFLKARGVYTNKPTTVSSYVGADAAKPAEKKPKPKLDAKVLNSYVGKKMAEAAVKMRQPGYNPPKQEHISSPEDQADGEMSALMLGGKKSLGKIKEAAAAPPFDKPYKKTTGTVTDKSGAKHGPMSKARDLARKGLKQMMQINPKIAEGWSDAALDQLDEVHPSVMAMAKVAGKQSLKAKADQHTELALAANRAGDDEKVRYHQAQVAKIKAQMQTAQAEGYIDFTRPSGAAYDATMVKGKMAITPNKPYEPYGAAPAKKKVTKLPMSQAAQALAAEAVSYSGLGTDVVDKKKKLNPQPNLIMKPKQVKDFKEGKVYDPITKKMVTTKPIKVQAGGGATRNGVPVETGPSKYKTISQAYHAATAGQTVTPKQKLKNKEVELDEGKMKDIYTSMMHHADKRGYSSHKQFKKADYDAVGKEHGISGGDVAIVAGHHTADSYNKLKEENLDELKASTLQRYADKAHQQAQDATYDAAHLNRSGEEKFKADAKKLASKRAGGVQRAQTKLDKMTEELTDQVPTQFAHGIADVVQCKRTQRLASIISAEDDKYTVVYADGSTETGPADYWTAIRPVTEGRIIEQPRGWNVKHLKPAGHGIVGKKVRSYDFPGMHDSHYIEGHVTDEDPQSYHIRTTKVVRHHKEEPVSSHMMHIRAPKGMSLFGGAQGVYYAPKEMKPAAKKTLGSLRGKK